MTTFSNKKLIEQSVAHRIQQMHQIARSDDLDFKLKHSNEYISAMKEKPDFSELDKRIKQEFIKHQQRYWDKSRKAGRSQ